jgi:hypothetical protein
MRLKLTEQQGKFINDHYRTMTLAQMAECFEHKSPWRVQKYMQDHGLKKTKTDLTDNQKKFVRENHLKFSESELTRKFKLKSRFLIQKFKREEGLMKYEGNSRKGIVVRAAEDQSFNVDEYIDWIF